MEKQARQEQTETTFYSLTNKSPTLPSESGKPIYEWTYLDEKGEIQADKSNFQEMIESYKRQVDYKLRIEKGE